MSISSLFETLVGKPTGWKKAAKVNCGMLIIASLILLSLSIVVIVNNNFDLIFILSGDCEGNLVSLANLALHLLINIVSTLVATLKRQGANIFNFTLASSDFFMQISNAPSREELDNAHAKGSWFEIGVPSVRNTLLVSKFKACCWAALLISSLPIHLLFNSTIFETDNRNYNHSLTIATEGFVHGSPYFPPGASLMVSGQQFVGLNSNENYTIGEGLGYGVGIDNRDYDIPESLTLRNISKAAKNASSWTEIDSQSCWESYTNCSALRKYGDLVIVVDKPAGWVRKDMWQLSTNESRFWDHYIPADKPNHLFFHAWCFVIDAGLGDCSNTCISAFGDQHPASPITLTRVLQDGRFHITGRVNFDTGSPGFPQDGRYSFIDPALIPALNGTTPSSLGIWNISNTLIEEPGDHTQRLLGFQHNALDLSMKYCLAETSQKNCRYYGHHTSTVVDSSLPPNASTAVRRSLPSLYALTGIFIVLMFMPIILGLKHLPQNSVESGCNSLALSSACHAPTVVYNVKNETESFENITQSSSLQSSFLPTSHLASSGSVPSGGGDDYEIQIGDGMVTKMRMRADSEGLELNVSHDYSTLGQIISEPVSDQRTRSLKKRSQSKIRWGIVKMPREWYVTYASHGPVEHLGFGTEEDMVSSPVSGHFYA
ncbi:hypothetical protein NUW58_g3982 [Xylaria curta]|uniref:Uncharacterized protein n=1 Tax=Xylaria curta TaxID=42375 RepID=A0ACC1P8I5_9PEZI|nr:hypothetical protein NUW58_g3982 [Xylaria curta]